MGVVNWGRLIEGTGKIERNMNWENDKEEEEEGGGGGGGERKRRKRKKKNGKNKEKVFSMCVKVGGPYGRCEIIIKNVKKILFK